MTLDKVVSSAADAVADIPDGASIAVGGRHAGDVLSAKQTMPESTQFVQ